MTLEAEMSDVTINQGMLVVPEMGREKEQVLP